MRNTVLTNIFKSPNKMTIMLERGQFLQQGGGLMEEKGVTPSHGGPVTGALLRPALVGRERSHSFPLVQDYRLQLW